jgi:hypothetical protein
MGVEGLESLGATAATGGPPPPGGNVLLLVPIENE